MDGRTGKWHPPGLLYDIAFLIMFRGLRRRVARTVEKGGLFPWLDVCCGTGDQLRERARGRVRGHVALVRVPVSIPDPALPRVPDPAPLASASVAPDPGSPSVGLALGLDLSFGLVRYAAARAPGVPFVCGDASRLPFKSGSLGAVSVSFGLHDKSPALRSAIIEEARRALAPDGHLIAVDFERPWNAKSRAGYLFTWAIERLAPREHYRNGRDFLRRGGLRAFLRENGFTEVDRRNVETGSLAVVVARPL